MKYSDIESVALTQQMVQIESTNPGTYETALGEFVYDWLAKTGAKMHKDEVFPNRYNIIAKLEGEIDDPSLIYVCHMDTVPFGEGWTKDPLGAEIIDGVMYGRGSADMKAGLAAGMIAFREIAALGKKPKHSFLFIASVDEEDIMLGAESIIKKGWGTKNSWMLDAEPTDRKIMVAHKGKTWFKLKAVGKSAHASTPENGIDAVSAMAEIITSINKRITKLPTHKEMGPCSATYGTIHGGMNVNCVPGECELGIDMRLVPPVTNEESIQLVRDAIAEGIAKVPGSTCELTITAQRPGIDRDDTSFLLAKLKEAVKAVRGQDAVITFFPGYTDTAVAAALTGNHNCMSYGPGRLADIHMPDEFCNCDDMQKCAEVMTHLAKSILF